jgi:hypothetical protein
MTLYDPISRNLSLATDFIRHPTTTDSTEVNTW